MELWPCHAVHSCVSCEVLSTITETYDRKIPWSHQSNISLLLSSPQYYCK